jgi:hypothetical protein
MSSEAKPRPGLRPELRLVPLPFATFGELLAFGLEVRAYCLKCHTRRRVDIGLRRLRKPFVGARFRCTCGSSGHPSITPPGGDAVVDDVIEYFDFYCGRCVPPWEIRNVRFDRPPWSTCTLQQGERFACPGCGQPITIMSRNLRGTPFTPRFGAKD